MKKNWVVKGKFISFYKIILLFSPILIVTLFLSGNSTACLFHCVGSWILDSDASDHVVGNPSLTSNLSPPKLPHSITLANCSKAQVIGIGQALPLPSLSLNYVLFVLDCPFNLISICVFLGYSKTQKGNQCYSHVRCKTDWLSHASSIWPTSQKLNSCSKCFNHTSSLVAWAIARYSASVLDRATTVCFLLLYEMRFPATKNTHLRAVKCVFLGYSRMQKGNQCYSHARCKGDWLSHASSIWPTSQKFNSCSKCFNHTGSLVAWDIARYSASVLDRATIVCFLLFHEMRFPPTKIQ